MTTLADEIEQTIKDRIKLDGQKTSIDGLSGLEEYYGLRIINSNMETVIDYNKAEDGLPKKRHES